MMKRHDINEMSELRPRSRALRALELGAELAQERSRRYPRRLPLGRLPHSFREDRIGKAAPYLQSLHGVRDVPAIATSGARKIGDIAIGRRSINEYVLSTRSLNQQRRIAQRRYRREPMADLAERQLLLTLMETDPIVRLCGAYAYWQATGARDVAAAILATGLTSEDPEVCDIACHGLAKMGPAGARRLRSKTGDAADDEPHSPVFSRTRSMTVLIHGTFAKDAEWYQPGGTFHRYIKNNVYRDLYSDDDFFFWSGRYTHQARRAAAKKLVAWSAEHPTGLLRFIAHSHGANVVNLATTMGLQTCTLIHLSPPVFNQYLPNPNHIDSQRFFTIRPRIDLVVFIDGGASDYRNTPVASLERRRIIAFSGHSESHEPSRWRRKNVPSLVRSVCP